EDAEMKLLTKAAKQRRDSLEVYREQGREDLAEVEASELAIIEEFLPKQLSAEEVQEEINAIISNIGASGMQDMGKVMGVATKQLAGRADGKAISQAVKTILSS
ncbi:MAG: GatB/YqeY domain-containing protein, partial [Cyclobacteriaceae bacterium]